MCVYVCVVRVWGMRGSVEKLRLKRLPYDSPSMNFCAEVSVEYLIRMMI